MQVRNLFSGISGPSEKEIFETLSETDHFMLERIVSSGQATPPGEWYDQNRDEWVLVLKGRAGLLFEGEGEVVVMGSGDYVHIPAHKRHRVEWTDNEQKTIWLALHYK